MNATTRFDLIIHARWIVTVETLGEVLENHALLIQNDRIVDIQPSEQVKGLEATQTIHLDQHILMPGLVNLHGHSAMSLLRGMADDKNTLDWLQNDIWPAEARHVSDEFVFDGAQIAMAEMIRGGTTTVNDMYFNHSAMAKAALSSGMRAFVGCSILEFPTVYAQNADDYIQKGLRDRAEFLGEKLVTFTLAPHAPYTVSDETFKKVNVLAQEHDMLVHCHIHETLGEVEDSVKQYGLRPLERLERIGFLNERLIAAHMVHLSDAEIDLVAQRKVRIAHNPASNMKLASGIAPITKLLDKGVIVGVGTDGAASNNQLNMFNELRLSALLAKVGTLDPTVIPAAKAIELSTLQGARALNLGDEIGSIRIGKQADLLAIDVSAIETQPMFDPISHIAYAVGREQVSHVWVAGKNLMQNRQLSTLSLATLTEKAQTWQATISSQRATS